MDKPKKRRTQEEMKIWFRGRKAAYLEWKRLGGLNSEAAAKYLATTDYSIGHMKDMKTAENEQAARDAEITLFGLLGKK